MLKSLLARFAPVALTTPAPAPAAETPATVPAAGVGSAIQTRAPGLAEVAAAQETALLKTNLAAMTTARDNALTAKTAAENERTAALTAKAAAEAERDAAKAAQATAEAALVAAGEALAKAESDRDAALTQAAKTVKEVTETAVQQRLATVAAAAGVSPAEVPAAIGSGGNRDEEITGLRAQLAGEKDPVARGKIAAQIDAIRWKS